MKSNMMKKCTKKYWKWLRKLVKNYSLIQGYQIFLLLIFRQPPPIKVIILLDQELIASRDLKNLIISQGSISRSKIKIQL